MSIPTGPNAMSPEQPQGADLFKQLVTAGQSGSRDDVDKKIKDFKDSNHLTLLKEWISEKEKDRQNFFEVSPLYSKIRRQILNSDSSLAARVVSSVTRIFASAIPLYPLEKAILDPKINISENLQGTYNPGGERILSPDVLSLLGSYAAVGHLNEESFGLLLDDLEKLNLHTVDFILLVPLLNSFKEKAPSKFVEFISKLVGIYMNSNYAKYRQYHNVCDYLNQLAAKKPELVLEVFSKIELGDRGPDGMICFAFSDAVRIFMTIACIKPEILAPFFMARSTLALLDKLKCDFDSCIRWKERCGQCKTEFVPERLAPIIEALLQLSPQGVNAAIPYLQFLASYASSCRVVSELFLKKLESNEPSLFMRLGATQALPILIKLAFNDPRWVVSIIEKFTTDEVELCKSSPTALFTLWLWVNRIMPNIYLKLFPDDLLNTWLNNIGDYQFIALIPHLTEFVEMTPCGLDKIFPQGPEGDKLLGRFRSLLVHVSQGSALKFSLKFSQVMSTVENPYRERFFRYILLTTNKVNMRLLDYPTKRAEFRNILIALAEKCPDLLVEVIKAKSGPTPPTPMLEQDVPRALESASNPGFIKLNKGAFEILIPVLNILALKYSNALVNIFQGLKIGKAQLSNDVCGEHILPILEVLAANAPESLVDLVSQLSLEGGALLKSLQFQNRANKDIATRFKPILSVLLDKDPGLLVQILFKQVGDAKFRAQNYPENHGNVEPYLGKDMNSFWAVAPVLEDLIESDPQKVIKFLFKVNEVDKRRSQLEYLEPFEEFERSMLIDHSRVIESVNPIFNKLCDNYPEIFKELLFSNVSSKRSLIFEHFKSMLPVLQHLAENNIDLLVEILTTAKPKYWKASQLFPILNCLIEKNPQKLLELLSSSKFTELRSLLTLGNEDSLRLVKFLVEKSPQLLENTLLSQDGSVNACVFQNFKLMQPVLTYLLDEKPDLVFTILNTGKFSDWRVGHSIPILNLMIAKSPDNLKSLFDNTSLDWNKLGSVRPVKQIVPILKFLMDNDKFDLLVRIFVEKDSESNNFLNYCEFKNWETKGSIDVPDILSTLTDLAKLNPEKFVEIITKGNNWRIFIDDELTPIFLTLPEEFLRTFLENHCFELLELNVKVLVELFTKLAGNDANNSLIRWQLTNLWKVGKKFLQVNCVLWLPLLTKLAENKANHPFIMQLFTNPGEVDKEFLQVNSHLGLTLSNLLAQNKANHPFIKDLLTNLGEVDKEFLHVDSHLVLVLQLLTKLANNEENIDFVIQFLFKKSPPSSNQTFLDRYPMRCRLLLQVLQAQDQSDPSKFKDEYRLFLWQKLQLKAGCLDKKRALDDDDIKKLKRLSPEQFGEEARRIQTILDNAWAGLIFQETKEDPLLINMVPYFHLDIQIKEGAEPVHLPSQQIKSALDRILENIAIKSAVDRGGVPEFEPDKSLFFSRLLASVTSIMNLLEGKPPAEVAAYLVQLAKPELEARCMARIKLEAQQIQRSLSGKPMTGDQFIEGVVTSVLELAVESCAKEYQGRDAVNVHILNSFKFAANLSTQWEFLVDIVGKQAILKFIKEHIDCRKLVLEFGQAVPLEATTAYLMEKTPEDFNPDIRFMTDSGKEENTDYNTEKQKVEKQERSILTETQEAIAFLLPNVNKQKVMESFVVLRGASLEKVVCDIEETKIPGDPKITLKQGEYAVTLACAYVRKNVSTEVYSALFEQDETSSDTDSFEERLNAQKRVSCPKEQRGIIVNPQVLSKQQRQFSAEMQGYNQIINAAKAFDGQMKGLEVAFGSTPLDAQQQVGLLKIYIKYRERLVKIGEDSPAAASCSYDRNIHGLPSQVIEQSRCVEYNKEWLAPKNLQIIKILEMVGVLDCVKRI